jgi:outer membrane receptor protein involved in Fe transport
VPDSAGSPANDTVIELPGIDVVASILPRGPRIASGVPARSAVIDRRSLTAWQPRLLTEALASRTGFSLYDDLGSPFKQTLVARGFAASPVVGLPQGLSVFLDGVPVNEADAGQVNFDLLPLDQVQRVEVLRGTASLLGPYSLGGAVNLVTRRGGAADRGGVELSAGSFGAREASASAAGELGGFGYYAGATWATEDGWRRRTGGTLHNALVNLDRVGGERGISLQALLAGSRAGTAGSLPLSVYEVRPDSNLTAGDFEDLGQLHLALSGYAPVATGRGSFRVYLRRHEAERFNVNQATDPDVRSFSENRTIGATADWRWLPSQGDLSVRLGAAGSVHRASVRIFAERIDPGLTTHVETPIRELGLYSELGYRRGRVALSGGVRADAVRVPFRNRLNPERDTTNLFLRLSPSAGVRVDAGGGASLYASMGQSFRAPAVIELACANPENPCPLPFALGDDPPLDPVVATTFEAGLDWRRGPLAAGVSAFRTDVRDEILLFPYEDESEPQGSTIDGFFANVDRTRRAGVELDGRVALRGGHSLFLNYAYTRATFEVEGVELFSIRSEAGGENVIEPGDRLPLVPAHTLRAGAVAVPTRSLEVGLEARVTGSRRLRGDEANEERPLPGYTVVDARVGYAAGAWRFEGIVSNLLDADYAAFGTFNLNQGAGGVLERFLTPGSPRGFRLVLTRGFGAAARPDRR